MFLGKLYIIILIIGISWSFKIPGISFDDNYELGYKVDVWVNELDSVKTQLPFEYYFLNFCKPEEVISANENLGTLLTGEKTQNTPYELFLGIDQYCKQLCVREMNQYSVNNFIWMIEREYNIQWKINDLPGLYNQTSLMKSGNTEKNQSSQQIGTPIGFQRDNQYYINNHVRFIVHTHENPKINKSRIVGFTIEVYSLLHKRDPKGNIQPFCNYEEDIQYRDYPEQSLVEGPIVFTYDAIFNKSEIQWASRWDAYQILGDEKIHWVSIINSILINLSLTGVIAYIMRRAVKNDIRQYQQIGSNDEIVDDSGWKQLSADVFRPPQNSILLSVLVGIGVQLTVMSFMTLVSACLGFMNPHYRGSLLTTIVLLFLLLGLFSGYYSARMYKMQNGVYWLRCTILTATLYPGANFAIFLILNFFLIAEESSGAVPFRAIIELLALWFCVQTPLVFIGAFVGFKRQAIENPCRQNKVPRFISEQPFYLNNFFCCCFGGLLPFGAVLIEVTCIMMSVWRHSFYYLFFFLMITAIILVITCAEISIVITYLLLCNGNHRWWWKAFIVPGSSAIYLFLYSFMYYETYLDITRFSSTMLYFGYMIMVSITFFIVSGSIGFLASFFFMRKIYSMIKID